MNTYKKAGVDKEEGYKTVDLIKPMAKKTYNKNVLTELGHFGALYELGKYKNPVLVSGTDGVGTKIKIAIEVGKLDGQQKRLPATIVGLSHYDPKKARPQS